MNLCREEAESPSRSLRTLGYQRVERLVTVSRGVVKELWLLGDVDTEVCPVLLAFEASSIA